VKLSREFFPPQRLRHLYGRRLFHRLDPDQTEAPDVSAPRRAPHCCAAFARLQHDDSYVESGLADLEGTQPIADLVAAHQGKEECALIRTARPFCEV
jgi:hypothetical protein